MVPPKPLSLDFLHYFHHIQGPDPRHVLCFPSPLRPFPLLDFGSSPESIER